MLVAVGYEDGIVYEYCNIFHDTSKDDIVVVPDSLYRNILDYFDSNNICEGEFKPINNIKYLIAILGRSLELLLIDVSTGNIKSVEELESLAPDNIFHFYYEAYKVIKYLQETYFN